MASFRDASPVGAPSGPVSPFRAEAERHRRFLAGRIAPLGTSAGAAESGAGPLVLVVEDDEGTSAALEALLGDSGYRVAATCLGEEAVRMARELVPDVVLLDLVLPRSSGLETVRVLREQDGTGGIPVVAMTGLWLGDQPDVLVAAGFDGSLRKPYTAAELFAELERVLAPAAEEGRGVA
jgi:two-component system cell cycle response regulator DivK